MNINTKVKWLSGLLGICVIAIAVESYYLWSAEKSGHHKNLQADNVPAFSTTVPNPWSRSWDPSEQFKQMQQQMDNLMNQMSTASSMFDQQELGMASATPKISTQDEADKYQVVVDVPRGQKVEINTNVSGNKLTIEGKVKQTNASQSNNTHEQSLSISQFSQTMQFPEPVKDSGVKIQRNDNQIIITVPKVG